MKLQATLLAATFMLAACSTNTVEGTVEKSEAKSEMKSAKTTELCTTFGPQTPRDISNKMGINPVEFTLAPASTELNLCNIHTHTNAEHKGPGFSVFVNDSDSGGYACNDAGSLTDLELLDPYAWKHKLSLL